jgi:hypothetical protein
MTYDNMKQEFIEYKFDPKNEKYSNNGLMLCLNCIKNIDNILKDKKNILHKKTHVNKICNCCKQEVKIGEAYKNIRYFRTHEKCFRDLINYINVSLVGNEKELMLMKL